MDNSTSEKNVDALNKSIDWPASGLEHIGVCPVCNASQRTLMHEGLIDNVFFCAPGKWNLWRCSGCESAYLDPRPSKDSIHLAYENYYTHQKSVQKDEYSSLNFVRKLRRRLVNGYINWRYGARAFPASIFGVLAAFLIPGMKRQLDREYRHLPKFPKNGGALLDVGCGDGSFLIRARNVGWDVVGLDPDPKVAANGSMNQLIVHQGGIEYYKDEHSLFDVITLSHVIEHVHEPAKVLKLCHNLLKPGGQLWLETPNIGSFGHAKFRKNWRGLETPRHLVLFSKHSMKEAVLNAGFCKIEELKAPSPLTFIYQTSMNMENGLLPDEKITWDLKDKLNLTKAVIYEYLFNNYSEFTTFSMQKPGDRL